MQTPKFWQENNGITILLKPLSYLYRFLSEKNKLKKLKAQKKLSVPVIVVGNINAGGTGKTPVTIALISELQQRGLNVGLISRGYGRKDESLIVSDEKVSPELLGDEPYLIHQKTDVPVAVANQRYDAGLALLSKYPDLDVIVSDDGLQHYALYRDFEIAVFGQQGIGNGYMIPAGPLRESVERLKYVDAIITIDDSFNFLLPYLKKCYKITQRLGVPYQLNNFKQTQQWENFSLISAIAGIAHPNNFFNALSLKGLKVSTYPFGDHHTYSATDFINMIEPILMTEKDAVKCTHILHNHDAWVVPLETILPSGFIELIIQHINLKKDIEKIDPKNFIGDSECLN
ncbi:tetraacyldisaccharide 4'-kinase [Wohlfahrtiimonas larvae]|uniref:Tetraacyldisaccharide 4'-kinase n=1 Tax=Wohlfahrtiimonas larvae TaxID=1157986 RepID=A0ABP9MKM3_9GAMM|nr:tetraacyldisaccharide 4'-kinase [Wohlfahrtiimonas larvae]